MKLLFESLIQVGGIKGKTTRRRRRVVRFDLKFLTKEAAKDAKENYMNLISLFSSSCTFCVHVLVIVVSWIFKG